jgi:hypothetical protein
MAALVPSGKKQKTFNPKSKDAKSDRYTHKIYTHLGTRIKTHRLDEILRLEVREGTNNGSKYAILAIKL